MKYFEVEVEERCKKTYLVGVYNNETIEAVIEMDDWVETATAVETKVTSLDVIGWKEKP